MAVSADQIIIGRPAVTGGVLNAPPGTVLPVDAAAALLPAFTAVGYCDDTGLIQTIAATTTDIKAWGAGIVRTIQSDFKLTFKFVMLETSQASLGAYYGDDNVTEVTTALTVKMRGGDLPHKVWVFDMLDGVRKTRLVLPDANITDRGAVNYKDADAISYDCTMAAYPDDAGVNAYAYIL